MKKILLISGLAGCALVAQAVELATNSTAEQNPVVRSYPAARSANAIYLAQSSPVSRVPAATAGRTADDPELVINETNDSIEIRQLDREISDSVFKPHTSPKLRSSIALIYDETTQSPLYEKKPDAQAPIASITKLMTAMVVLDAQLPLDEVVRIEAADIDTLKGTRSRLKIGMTFTRRELLQLALMASENRAASALARSYPGGTAAAVTVMNAKAHALGMHDTHFKDPTGLNSDNVSTARDLVKMVATANEYGLIRQFTTTATHSVAGPRGRELRFNNTNPLVKSASWDIGVSKTGFINEAGRCLVMQAKIKQRPVIIVLLDSWGKRSRIGDANRVKKWMEGSYKRGNTSRDG